MENLVKIHQNFLNMNDIYSMQQMTSYVNADLDVYEHPFFKKEFDENGQLKSFYLPIQIDSQTGMSLKVIP